MYILMYYEVYGRCGHERNIQFALDFGSIPWGDRARAYKKFADDIPGEMWGYADSVNIVPIFMWSPEKGDWVDKTDSKITTVTLLESERKAQ
jgi:hypothetical protein